jgi:SHS2 domain-containing protein
MGTFEILPHTADVGFRATGDSLADLFETAGRAMFSIEYDLASVEGDQEKPVAVESGDLESLLETWLSELVWLHDAMGFAPADLVVREIGDSGAGDSWHLAGAAIGRSLGAWFEQTGPQIKAVTLHGLEVRQSEEGWQATVYLDV